MQISVKEAQENLAELLDRVESGEDIVLTRDGKMIARIIRTPPALTREECETAFDRIRAMAPPRMPGEPTADRSHDDLHDEDGLPA
ncbi:type II toxin-antitoxin system prevent-host-death family antitoxin [Rhizobium sp. FY34]|uniref:type II toxin-antitoxin system Phd/YefM family antitoxin n=1 Tax=Rhizobium sp. FY34 TaxID=2562309 RepID=UPI0010C085EA|nr:type II toxin-antitoxin system prevent-host-death family antitoxin [Rhizobium sp. FY34]